MWIKLFPLIVLLLIVFVLRFEKYGVHSHGLISNGHPSEILKSPWKAAIYRNDFKKNLEIFSYTCGGVLISEDSVLTGKSRLKPPFICFLKNISI